MRPETISGSRARHAAGEKMRSITHAEVDEWLRLSRRLEDASAALHYAQRAAEARPNDPEVRDALQQCLTDVLQQDAFVGFVEEHPDRYVAQLQDSTRIVVPKSRRQAEVYPSPDRTAGERALHSVWWLVLGLIPAGLGALVFGPVLMWRSLNVLSRDRLEPREQRMAALALLLAGILCLLGLGFSMLLLLHFA